MEIRHLAIPDARLVIPVISRDDRGFFSETYRRSALTDAGIDADFVQDNHSLSEKPGTVRGLHFQIPPRAQGKLVRVTRGSIFDVAVDIRAGSPTYGRHVSYVLSAANWTQLWAPPGFAHGFCSLEAHTEVVYKLTDYYTPDCDRGLKWNDPALAINWPVTAESARVSEKDRRHPGLVELPAYFRYES